MNSSCLSCKHKPPFTINGIYIMDFEILQSAETVFTISQDRIIQNGHLLIWMSFTIHTQLVG